jgi:hypothetical protein
MYADFDWPRDEAEKTAVQSRVGDSTVTDDDAKNMEELDELGAPEDIPSRKVDEERASNDKNDMDGVEAFEDIASDELQSSPTLSHPDALPTYYLRFCEAYLSYCRRNL